MDYNDVRRKFAECPAFLGLDDVSRALLFWKGTVAPVSPGTTVYSQGAVLDDSFYLLLSGELVAEVDGRPVGSITENQIFGEMAFLYPSGRRTATIRPAVTGCLLRFELSQAELSSPAFRPLKEHFKSEAWTKFVSNAQAQA